MKSYPNLTATLKVMFIDNCGPQYDDCVKPEADWKWPKNVDLLEAQAAKLTPSEKGIMACGEHTEIEDLVKSKRLGKLHNFLNHVFDGNLSKNFYHDGTDN